ncbi:hypothetical protein F4604DRAFT_1695140 [Suillus subluteus]|nr:hypothetical protein F4604DRAFT_1695140 [Suillus subluteus]
MSHLSAILLTASAVYASIATAHKSHTENNPLGNRWYHVGDGIIYPAIGALSKPLLGWVLLTQPHDPINPTVCSSTAKSVMQVDVCDAPPGVIALSFDDGPLPASNQLYQFLASHSEYEYVLPSTPGHHSRNYQNPQLQTETELPQSTHTEQMLVLSLKECATIRSTSHLVFEDPPPKNLAQNSWVMRTFQKDP